MMKTFAGHGLFWTAYVVLNALINGAMSGRFMIQLQYHLFYMPVVMMATYFTIYILIDKLLLKRRVGLFAAGSMLSMLFFCWLLHLDILYVVGQFLDVSNYRSVRFFSFPLLYRVVQIYTTVALAAALKLAIDWYDREHRLLQAQRLQAEAELRSLKLQLHPHFLFNTLNNLYALILKQSPQAPEALLKLSGLLEVLLSQKDQHTAALEQDVQFLENYMALETLRFGPELRLSFRCDIKNEERQVPPQLFLPIVENAFKHGRAVDGVLNIDISLKEDDDSLSLICVNSFSPGAGSSMRPGGLGLNNLRRRLEWHFPGKYKFERSAEGSQYRTALQLDGNI